MVALEDKLLTRIDGLLAKGQAMLSTHDPRRGVSPGYSTNNTLPADDFAEWKAQTRSFLASLLGTDHLYFQQFETDVPQATVASLTRGMGIIRAVREDVAGSYLGVAPVWWTPSN